MPDCSPSAPCETGFRCDGGVCVFDDSTTLDFAIVSVTIPALDPDGDAWDFFWGTGNADVYVEVSAVEPMMMGRVPGSGSVEASDSHIAVFSGAAAIAVRGQPARNYLTTIQATVFDDDEDPVIGALGRELIGECEQTVTQEMLSGDPVVWACPLVDGLSLTVRFTPPR